MSERNERRRELPGITFPAETAYYERWSDGHKTHMPSLALDPIRGRQITVSEGHPWYSRDKHKKTADIGGDFYTMRQYTRNHKWVLWHMEAGQNGESYFCESPNVVMGPISANPPFPPAEPMVDPTLDSLGATAVARCKPTNSIADLSVFLGELFKDGLPNLIGHTLWSDKVDFLRKLGKEYLNIEFGWKPLVSEIRSFAEVIRRANSVIKQMERDNGKLIRRRYSFPVESSISTTSIGDHQARVRLMNFMLRNTVPQGEQFLTRETVRQTWFSGAFIYHLPPEYFRSRLAELATRADWLLGTTLTPETLWNLAPWSWAVDWFSNTGDTISNIEDHMRYSLVMPYGYLMRKTITTDTYHFADPPPPYAKGAAGWTPLTLVTETKIRKRAHPYGFGVKWEDLDPRQLAILAAIGITR
jgi:hypothetical protein